ncbi:type II toxin-antitoxin system VapC family toxin [Pseudothauera hydrothermalis]|uniref:type II toxin-antitoxin system VapC family toxin n=1 Tax=Pseudothauera hydrothermalis TaxID=2184083 RepID=UPI000E09DAD3|nr:type II toxin-antitoxin system VapC family toxin [Pseudothauera hydrothermalis]
MLVYPDTCMVIYAVERHAEFASRLHEAWVRSAYPKLAVSELTRLECRVGRLRLQDASLLGRYEHFFASPGLFWAALSRSVFELATELRARHRPKTPDALHLAAAIEAGCDEFWTNDHRLDAAASGHLRTVTL